MRHRLTTRVQLGAIVVTFETAVALETNGPESTAIVDVNGDSRPDLVTAAAPQILVALGSKTG